MRKLIVGILVMALLTVRAAGAITVLTPKSDDLPERLDAARQAVSKQALGHYGMTPVRGTDVADGTYAVDVASTSPFFKVVSAELTVSGDEMTLAFLIGSDSYEWVCRATAADAEAAEWIEGEAVPEGTRFTVPIPALNAPFPLAAFSRSRQMWYDRQLLVDAASLPPEALSFELPDYALLERALLAYEPAGASEAETAAAGSPEPVNVDWPDGRYAIEVNLMGGSGRASVSSPTVLTVRDGTAWARLLWSSSHYDYMLLDGQRYDNLSEDGGNSTFEIPVTAMDEPIEVIADTTAMGDPLEIRYQLTFYSESIGDVSQVPQEAAMKVFLISLAIIAVGGVLNFILKRRRR